jgi:hypothetical protein
LPLALPPDSARWYKARFTPATVSFRGPASLVNALPDPYIIDLPAPSARGSSDELEVAVRAPARVRPSVATVQLSLVQVVRPARRRK